MASILLIEDEPGIAETIGYALEMEGFELVWHPTAGEGRKALEQKPPALVILDVGLPDGNGFDLCRYIRANFQVPIIFLTARTDEIDRVVGLELGADDYVVKPFSPRELTARIKAVLRRTTSIPATKTNAVPPPGKQEGSPRFLVDEGRCTVWYGKESLELTRYEFLILKVLIERPEWVFSRQKLMDLVWDEPETSTERTVDAHIKSIRAKLRKAGCSPDPIKTHRGMGYAFKDGACG